MNERILYLYSSLFLILQLILILGKYFDLALNNDFISLGITYLIWFIARNFSEFIIGKTEKKGIQESN